MGFNSAFKVLNVTCVGKFSCKSLSTKFRGKPSGGGLADTCSEMGRYDEDNAKVPGGTDIWKNLF